MFGGSKDVSFNQEISDLLGTVRIGRVSHSSGGFNGGGKNAGSAIIALNTVYTQAINLATIGDGTGRVKSRSNTENRWASVHI